jgi:3-oxoacyl-[acyl-carrier protein] reductase
MELRAGATGNGVLLRPDVTTAHASALAAVRFFLSGRSAFVDGQFITVSTTAGELPGDPEKPLAGRIAVVTGAARGIGAAIARTLHRDGATLVLVDIPAAGDQLAAVANEVRGTALQLDISREDAGQRILQHAVQRHGRLDIMIHNAGITRDKLLVNMDEARWNSVININIAAQLRINKALLASEHFRTSPRIVSVASTSGIAGNRGQTNYAASKGGVMGMVRATGPLLAGHGGSINAVAPGFIETEMTARIPFALREMGRRLNSLQQGGQPSDVAETIAFLASDAAGGINGEVLRVCGQNLVGA